jgi:flagellar motility protein MotE (MotC chaperone)
MMRLVHELRLFPVVLFAIVCLFALKVLGIAVDGGYVLSDSDATLVAAPAPPRDLSGLDALDTPPAAPARKRPWAREMFNFPDVTGAVANDKPAAKPPEAPPSAVAPAASAKPAEGKPSGGGTVIPLDGPRPASPAERSILERLGERRQELDTRARELDIRENLLRSAEKRLESRVNELKDLEARISGAYQKRDEADAQRLKSLVTMYENMRAKDAAKIFDRLDLRVLVEVVSQINPRRMSDIMAQMQPETAERLTVELANRANGAGPAQTAEDLPKIEGKPVDAKPIDPQSADARPADGRPADMKPVDAKPANTKSQP